MNKIKETWNKYIEWDKKEVPYTNGDALLQLIMFLNVIALALVVL